jgi:hypothetical protein
MITVRDLIVKLQQEDQDAIVAVYSEIDEGFDFAHDVCVQSRDNPDAFLYCKTTHPLDRNFGWFPKDADNLVVVR